LLFQELGSDVGADVDADADAGAGAGARSSDDDRSTTTHAIIGVSLSVSKGSFPSTPQRRSRSSKAATPPRHSTVVANGCGGRGETRSVDMWSVAMCPTAPLLQTFAAWSVMLLLLVLVLVVLELVAVVLVAVVLLLPTSVLLAWWSVVVGSSALSNLLAPSPSTWVLATQSFAIWLPRPHRAHLVTADEDQNRLIAFPINW